MKIDIEKLADELAAELGISPDRISVSWDGKTLEAWAEGRAVHVSDPALIERVLSAHAPSAPSETPSETLEHLEAALALSAAIELMEDALEALLRLREWLEKQTPNG